MSLRVHEPCDAPHVVDPRSKRRHFAGATQHWADGNLPCHREAIHSFPRTDSRMNQLWFFSWVPLLWAATSCEAHPCERCASHYESPIPDWQYLLILLQRHPSLLPLPLPRRTPSRTPHTLRVARPQPRLPDQIQA